MARGADIGIDLGTANVISVCEWKRNSFRRAISSCNRKKILISSSSWRRS